MGAITLIKRTVLALIGLGVLVVISISFLAAWFQSNPPDPDRIEAMERAAKHRVDEDSGVMEKIAVLVSTWWESDDLVAEAKQEKADREREREADRRAEEERRFNTPQYYGNDDYYPSGN